MNKHRFAFLTIATILGLTTVFAFATVASAQGAGIYELVGSTSQGEGLELVVIPGDDMFTVTSVRLSGAVVRCAKSYQDLDLGAIVFPANTQIKTSSPPPPFTISRLLTDDHQVALLITGQAMSDVQVRVTLTVFLSHLYYAGLNDTLPTAERCTVVLPVILQLIAID
jgi:hypothetical protein